MLYSDYIHYKKAKMLKKGFYILGCVGMLYIAPANAMHTDVVRTQFEGAVIDSFGNHVHTCCCGNHHGCDLKHTYYEYDADYMLSSATETVHFDLSSSTLKESEKYKLDDIIYILDEYEVQNVTVHGYADISGNKAKNLSLSTKRALAVYDYLQEESDVIINYGLPVKVKGLGGSSAKHCSHDKNGHHIKCLAANRRVVVKVDFYDDLY